MSHRLEFHDDPAAFFEAAGSWLEQRPVESTVVASVTARLARDGLPRMPYGPWWLVARDAAGEVAGVGMRTFPHPPYPPYLLSMPAEAAVGLARVLHDRGEAVPGCNGASASARDFVEAYAGLTGGRVRVAEQVRLHELHALDPAPVPPGSLRIATADDTELVLAWFDAFSADAAEQAGSPDPHPAPIESRESTARRIEAGEVWLWQDAEGIPVHLTAYNPPSFGVARVGPVYTPKAHRGHGYAAITVCEVSRMLLEGGSRVCLFTDQANPTSNALYERLGYRPVVDMANLVIQPAVGEDGVHDPASS